MKKFIIGIIIGLIVGFMVGFSVKSVDFILKVGQQLVTSKIDRSLEITGGVPIIYNGEKVILSITSTTDE